MIRGFVRFAANPRFKVVSCKGCSEPRTKWDGQEGTPARFLVRADAESAPKAVLEEIGLFKNFFFFLPNIDDVGKVGKIYWGESQNFPPFCPPVRCFCCLSFSEVLHMDYICLSAAALRLKNPQEPQGNQ